MEYRRLGSTGLKVRVYHVHHMVLPTQVMLEFQGAPV
jgi:hypothetical protein